MNWPLCVIGVVTIVLAMSQEAPKEWKPYDNFDLIKDRMASVTRKNCRSKSANDLMLPREAVSPIPESNPLLRNAGNKNCLLQLHNLALNRAYYFSFIYQHLNKTTLTDFKKQPGLMYYYMSVAADVSAGTGCLDGSAIYFDNKMNYANFLQYMYFNQTLPLFAPRAWHVDDYNGPRNSSWFNEFVNRTINVKDVSAGRNANYTSLRYKSNPWYRLFLPDISSGKDILKKFAYSIGIKLSNTTGKFLGDEYNAVPFFGPPQPGQQDCTGGNSMPVLFTRPYFDCGRSNKWVVSAVSPIVDFLPRYTAYVQLMKPRFVGEAVMDTGYQKIDINPCPAGAGNPDPNMLAGTARCKNTTQCEPLDGFGFHRGGYRCVCLQGYRYPPQQNGPFLGIDIEQASKVEYDKSFDCFSVDDLGEKTPGPLAIQKNASSISSHRKRREGSLRSNLNLNSEISRLISDKIEDPVVEENINISSDPCYNRNTVTAEQKTTFDQDNYIRGLRLLNRLQRVEKCNCKTKQRHELFLPKDVGFGADVQFEAQARTGLRLAHFLSSFLQNVREGEQYTNIVGDRLLHETHIFGEVLSNVMGDFRIYSSGVFFDKNKFQMSPPAPPYRAESRHVSGLTREFFGPFAYRVPDPQLGRDTFKAIDFAGYTTPYTNDSWFLEIKDRWDKNPNILNAYKIKPMVRSDINGTSLVKFEHYPMFYRVPTYEDGVWLQPQFKCDGLVDSWVVTYAVPFFGLNHLKTDYEFYGVVTVDVKLDLLNINQCPLNADAANAFKNTARCDFETTDCVHSPGHGFALGGYRCECKPGYTNPFSDEIFFFEGQTMEEEWGKKLDRDSNSVEALKCTGG